MVLFLIALPLFSYAVLYRLLQYAELKKREDTTMGLFDFVKDVGRQIFDTDAEAADNIKQHLEVKTTGIKDLTVEFDDGVATLCGNCSSQAVRDQAVLIAGNIKGVEKVVADDLKAPPPKPEEPKEKAEFYEIVSGDTLGGIAKKFYGSAGKYMRIFEANRDIISDPNKIYPGQKIKIPLD
jgi:nucleoid-associated protein YgaU